MYSDIHANLKHTDTVAIGARRETDESGHVLSFSATQNGVQNMVILRLTEKQLADLEFTLVCYRQELGRAKEGDEVRVRTMGETNPGGKAGEMIARGYVPDACQE